MSTAFTQIQLGDKILSNRILMGSMHLGMEGEVGTAERLASFYGRRFEGGVEFIVTGGIGVNKEGRGSKSFFDFTDPVHQNEMQRMNSILSGKGVLCAQLFHAGRYAFFRECVAPSAIRAPINRYVPKALTEEEAWKTIEDFGTAAKIAYQTGFGSVEIMGSEGYLINQFCSPVTNKRTDFFGGDGKKRANFGIEVLKSVRKNLPKDFPILYRISGIDLIPDSSSFDDVVYLANSLKENGVTALNVGIGWHESRIPTISQLVPRGAWAETAGNLKKEVKDVPIIVSNRINTPDTIQKIFDEGIADLISMARPFLADADIVKKLKNSESQRINTCIACNQACLDNAFSEESVSCIVNPRAVHETVYPIERKKPKKVIIIGSGPGGLEAARASAELGHEVTLIEKDSRIGGQLNLAAKIPGKSEFLETIRYFENELNALNVKILTNTEFTPELYSELGGEEIIFATGVKPRDVQLKGMETVRVLSYADFLKEGKRSGKNIAIIGGGGIGVDIAHFLTEEEPDFLTYKKRYRIDTYNQTVIERREPERKVAIFKRSGKIGAGLGPTTFWALKQELEFTGVEFIQGIQYREVLDGKLIYENRSGELGEYPCDTIILCAGQERELNPIERFKERFPDIKFHVIGGAKDSVGIDAKRAFREGLDIAYTISK
ncbi:MAG: NADPH-dependent 2,4-dienoyl-CoA reductase [Leptospiraceae bacterium]|nr:NADPH-dependent 2,4-dienoyl-CoA reductase [Leptospiraceae bacterium]MCP5510965.1 NADPH-dependent 2,4-dienoyl-CoA reductase [Leptospiraceae bacterium]